MTKDEWMQLADVALQAAIKTLRETAPKVSNKMESNSIHRVADYCEGIRDQRPKEG